MGKLETAGAVVFVILLVWLVYRVYNEQMAKHVRADAIASRAEEAALDAGTPPQEAAEIRRATYDQEVVRPPPPPPEPLPPVIPETSAPPVPAASTLLHALQRYDYHAHTLLGNRNPAESPWPPARGIATPEMAAIICDGDPRFAGCVGFDFIADSGTANFKAAIAPRDQWIATSWLPQPSGAYMRRA